MSNIWITGARGFIGRHVAKTLSARGDQVHGIGHGAWVPADRGEWGLDQWINSSISLASLDMLAASAGQLPDVVMHLAGGSSVGESFRAPREDFDRTAVASAELAEWVRLRSPETRIVAASSAAVYGNAWSLPIPRNASLAPYSPYGAHKAVMEAVLAGYATNFNIRVAVVRLFSVYGPGLEKQLLWDTCVRLARGERRLQLGGTGLETRDFVHVDDAAQLLANAARFADASCPRFNGGAGQAISIADIAARVCSLWDAGARAEFSGAARAGDPQHLVADMSDSQIIQPEAFISIDNGLSDTVANARARLRKG